MKFKHGFTLAELLTAVLVISIIMVALAPVITKRMKDNVSVTTDNKKGLEVYTNPGTYTFDVPIGINTLFIQGSGGGGGGAGASVSDPRTVTFTSNTTWKVPTGVNQITFEITGSGGGGGGGYAKTSSDSCVSGTVKHNWLADNGKDMCISDVQSPPNRAVQGTISTVKSGQMCTGSYCCWTDVVSSCKDSPAGGVSACGRTVCTSGAARSWCASYSSKVTYDSFAYKYGLKKAARLITLDEAKRILQRDALGAGSWNVCYYDLTPTYAGCDKNTPLYYNISKSAICDMSSQNSATGSWNSYAYPNAAWLANSYRYDGRCCRNPGIGISDENNTATVFCAYELDNWFQYSASGGASGAVLEKTINVLPNDTFEITIGTGGNGGSAGSNGSRGTDTKIVHKRKNIELGTYYVKGGLGGKAATSSSNGSAYTNGTASNNTTPSGTCYAKNRKDTDESFIGGNSECTTISYSGESGTELKGGSGGKAENKGTAAKGGEIDTGDGSNGTGYKATEYGFGGGGGTCARGVRTPSSCSKGGKGANGKVEITYKVALPGGGGGSSARVAGVDNNNKAYEIIYKVSEGDRIVFKVGSGGSGGVENQDGLNGSATVVGDNDIVFLAGEGGKTATDTDKNNLKGGRGGYTSYINEEDNIQSNIQTGIKLKSKTPPITYTINPPNNSFKGQNGTRGGVPEADTIQSGYTITNTIFSYGFNGGMGASPFNVEKSKNGASISCGGGIAGTLGQTTNLKYLCTSGNTKGNDARNHDPVNNEFGGSGGGGGGVKDDSFEQGQGGNGSSGYLRIRWDASEQE